MELDFYDELDKQEQEIENNEYWEQQYEDLQTRYDCLMETLKIQKDILARKNKIIDKAIEYIENPRHEMSVKTYQELEDILRGEDNE